MQISLFFHSDDTCVILYETATSIAVYAIRGSELWFLEWALIVACEVGEAREGKAALINTLYRPQGSPREVGIAPAAKDTDVYPI